MEKKELWKEQIEEQRSSGLTQKQWGNKKEVSVSMLRYWIQRFKKESQEPQKKVYENVEKALHFAGIIIASDVSNEQSSLSQASLREAIEIKIGDVFCSIFPKFSEDPLLSVIQVLKKA